METMPTEKTNMTLSSGLPPCPTRPTGSPPPPSDPSSGDEGCSSFEFWVTPFSLTDEIDYENDYQIDQMATLGYQNTNHSRSNSNEAGDDFKEQQQDECSTIVGDGRSLQCPSEIDIHFELARKIHPDMDPRKLRRIVTNRISAQRSRLRKIKYVSDLEHKRVSLQGTISYLSSQIVSESNKKHDLLDENTTLMQKISFLADDKILKNVEKKLLRKEADRLMKVLLRQKQEQEMMTSMMMMRMTSSELNQLSLDLPDLTFHYMLPQSIDESEEERSEDAYMMEEQSWIGSENDHCSSNELQQMVCSVSSSSHNHKIFYSDPTTARTKGDNVGSASEMSRNYDSVIKCETNQDLSTH